ncbi:class I SAM-dependent methyltransferase [Hymenobacter sp. BT770]|uniref:O-methyltransferase n=1 Tax=Hymenobacter sp. BT770 TaxID=2886942 RepID=UPI001D11AB1D|nr:class I SAM-dependent methyltransferase [Hymenobacter sp. BT770]MCC3152721.1 class I SAM-dependent methyltransferase [Hymenobacter sp. BT770]MDO3414794.1 class I SAM-dependent methyltransferase [Hymenobacter sp. BT770]
MFQLLAYLRFWLRSGNAHGLHSPFVFGLYTSVVRHTGFFGAYAPIEARRQELLRSPASIGVTDFGAGSHTGSGQQRRVADIARTAAKPPHLAKLLFRLVNYFRPATILELGTSLGLTTSYLAAADSRQQVVTFEGCPNVAAVARETFATLGLRNISIVEGNIDDTLAPALAALGKPVDFAFFDGNHRFEPTLRYFEQCLAHRTNESVFVFDDIHWSKEMERAWEAIKAHPEVTMTVDLFYIGLVFFRKNQPKQHFCLRT